MGIASATVNERTVSHRRMGRSDCVSGGDSSGKDVPTSENSKPHPPAPPKWGDARSI